MAGIVGSLTIIIARIRALLETDGKKIVALSTLRQLGVIILAISINNARVVFFHLVVHAFFKALLFIATGRIIHNSNDYQDLRFRGGLFKVLPFSLGVVVSAKLSLCGIPFFSAFFSKEIVLEGLASSGVRRVVLYIII